MREKYEIGLITTIKKGDEAEEDMHGRSKTSEVNAGEFLRRTIGGKKEMGL